MSSNSKEKVSEFILHFVSFMIGNFFEGPHLFIISFAFFSTHRHHYFFNKLPKAGFSDNATVAFKIGMMVMRHKKLVFYLFSRCLNKIQLHFNSLWRNLFLNAIKPHFLRNFAQDAVLAKSNETVIEARKRSWFLSPVPSSSTPTFWLSKKVSDIASSSFFDGKFLHL